jgi:hypothetical protein
MSKGVTLFDKASGSDVLLRFTVIRLAAVSRAEGDIAQNTDEAESPSPFSGRRLCDAGVSKGCLLGDCKS